MHTARTMKALRMLTTIPPRSGKTWPGRSRGQFVPRLPPYPWDGYGDGVIVSRIDHP